MRPSASSPASSTRAPRRRSSSSRASRRMRTQSVSIKQTYSHEDNRLGRNPLRGAERMQPYLTSPQRLAADPGDDQCVVHITAVGSNPLQYRYEAYAFDGTLQDLASQVAVDALIRQHGVKLQSNPFGPCPGAAGVATVRLPDAKVLQVGFAVHNGQAIRVRYVRPPGVPVDPDVVSAMQAALCSL